MACLPNPWSVSRWPSVSLSSNLQVSEAGAIHPYPSGATRGVSATNTLFQSVLHSTLLAGTVQITNHKSLYSCGSCHEPLKAFELEAAAANWPPLPLLDRGNLRKMLLDHLIRFIPCLLQFDSCLPERWISRIPQMLRSEGTTLAIDTNYTRRGPTHGQGTKGSIFNSLRFLWILKLWKLSQKYFFTRSYYSINMWYVIICTAILY